MRFSSESSVGWRDAAATLPGAYQVSLTSGPNGKPCPVQVIDPFPFVGESLAGRERGTSHRGEHDAKLELHQGQGKVSWTELYLVAARDGYGELAELAGTDARLARARQQRNA